MSRPVTVGLALLASATACAQPSAEPTAGDGDDGVAASVEHPAADSVRAARAAFNGAIAERAIGPIEALVMDDYVLITGRSAKYFGAEAHLDLWRGDFESADSYVYVRTPREVRVNPAFGIAEELGNWVGRPRSGDGSGEASGVYAAKWQRAEGGHWMLQSEVFTTLACAGPICAPPEPIEGR